jgi:acyl-CoA thioester hydrolase
MVPDGEFRFRHRVSVRFQDIDAAGHAHHSKPLIYFEEARWAYWRHVVGPVGVDDPRYVLAEFRVRYHDRVLYPDELQVGVRVTKLGKKHFVIEYVAWSEDGRPLASAESVQVMYDYETTSSIPIPDDVRVAISGWEGL